MWWMRNAFHRRFQSPRRRRTTGPNLAMTTGISSHEPSSQTHPVYSDFGSEPELESESESESESTLVGAGSTVGAGSGAGAVKTRDSSSKRVGQMVRNASQKIVHPIKTREKKRAAKRELRETEEIHRQRNIEEFLESGRQGPIEWNY